MFPFFCSGNFRGYGEQDCAVFLLNTDRPSYMVVAGIRKNGKMELMELTHGGALPQNLFLRIVPAGTYRPGKSTQQVGLPIVRRLRLTADGINFGSFESADCIFYWNPRASGFERVWISD